VFRDVSDYFAFRYSKLIEKEKEREREREREREGGNMERFVMRQGKWCN